jgi:hypothetical protein
MPACTGKFRRPNVGKGSTRSTSISFSTADFLWVAEQSAARGVSQSLVVAEALDVYRKAQTTEVIAIEKEQRKVDLALARAARAPTARAGAAAEPVEL